MQQFSYLLWLRNPSSPPSLAGTCLLPNDTTKSFGQAVCFGLWELVSLTLLFSRHFTIWKIILILVVVGSAVGMVFQPTLVAAEAHYRNSDRSVVTAIRNFLRSFGGAFGLALSAIICSNTLRSQLQDAAVALPASIITTILKSIFSSVSKNFDL